MDKKNIFKFKNQQKTPNNEYNLSNKELDVENDEIVIVNTDYIGSSVIKYNKKDYERMS